MADNIKENEPVAQESKKKNGKKLVALTLPLTYDKDVDAYPVTFSLNFKTYAIKRGETVMVPPAIKKIADEQEAARAKAYKYSLEKSLSTKEAEFKQRYNLG